MTTTKNIARAVDPENKDPFAELYLNTTIFLPTLKIWGLSLYKKSKLSTKSMSSLKNVLEDFTK